jgi:hypothetical protein
MEYSSLRLKKRWEECKTLNITVWAITGPEQHDKWQKNSQKLEKRQW